MKYNFINEYKNQFSIMRMCRVLNIKKGSYYAWSKRGTSNRDKENQMILSKIKKINDDKKMKCYGYPKVVLELKSQGLSYNHKRIARLMKVNNLHAILKKGHKYKNRSKNEANTAPNILNRNFNPEEINKVWVSDITYIATHYGWAYQCSVIDLFGKKVVGWAVSNSPNTQLVIDAISKAIKNRKPGKDLLIHSDQGCQYTSNEYINFIKDNGFIQSMSRRGNCWDNACVESFFGHLKNEWLYGKNYYTLEDVRLDIFYYIEGFYNTKRFHSANKNMTPADYEKKYA